MLRRVVPREPHLPDRQGPAEFAVHLLEPEVDERVAQELLDPVAGEGLALRGLRDEEGRHVLPPQEPREREQPLPELLDAPVVEADRGQGVDHEAPDPRRLQGGREELLELAEPDDGPPPAPPPEPPGVDQEEPAGPLEAPPVDPEVLHHPLDARLRLLEDDVHRWLAEAARAVPDEGGGEEGLPPAPGGGG